MQVGACGRLARMCEPSVVMRCAARAILRGSGIPLLGRHDTGRPYSKHALHSALGAGPLIRHRVVPVEP
eukprot:6071061-Pyramimonas_sp.AAC.1